MKDIDNGCDCPCEYRFMGGFILAPDGSKWWSELLVEHLEKRVHALEAELRTLKGLPSKEMLDCMAAFDKVEATQQANDKVIHLLNKIDEEKT